MRLEALSTMDPVRFLGLGSESGVNAEPVLDEATCDLGHKSVTANNMAYFTYPISSFVSSNWLPKLTVGSLDPGALTRISTVYLEMLIDSRSRCPPLSLRSFSIPRQIHAILL